MRGNIKRGNKVERILDHGFSVCHHQKGENVICSFDDLTNLGTS